MIYLLKSLRIAVPTNGHNGLDDVVSNVFGRAKTFTIVDIENERVKINSIIENPGVSYKYGAGPIVAKMLVDNDVNLVLANILGCGAEGLLKQQNIEYISIKPNIKVDNVIKEVIKTKKEVKN